MSLALNEYVSPDKLMEFLNQPGVLEVTGLPLLGNPPLADTIRHKTLAYGSPTTAAVMNVTLTDCYMIAENAAPDVTVTSSATYNTTRPYYSSGSMVTSMSLGIKQFVGDNEGILTKATIGEYQFNGITRGNSIIYAPDAGGAIETGFSAKTTPNGTRIVSVVSEQLQGNATYQATVVTTNTALFNEGGNNLGHRYWYNVDWYEITGPTNSNTPSDCDICVIRVKGKQWPRDPQTTTTSSLVRTGSLQASYDPRNRLGTRTAKQEKVAILTKMEESRHLLRTTRSARRLVRQTAVTGLPL